MKILFLLILTGCALTYQKTVKREYNEQAIFQLCSDLAISAMAHDAPYSRGFSYYYNACVQQIKSDQ